MGGSTSFSVKQTKHLSFGPATDVGREYHTVSVANTEVTNSLTHNFKLADNIWQLEGTFIIVISRDQTITIGKTHLDSWKEKMMMQMKTSYWATPDDSRWSIKKNPEQCNKPIVTYFPSK